MINRIEIAKALKDIVGSGNVEENASMARYTSFRAGGSADILVQPERAQQLKDTLKLLADAGLPYMVIGNGSNILVADEGYRGVMVRTAGRLGKIEVRDNLISCECGASLAAVARAAADAGLTGFEFASGIPGSVGGAIFMNAGAYGGEIKNILSSVRLISSSGAGERTMTAGELDMGYRHSALQESGDIALEAIFRLEPGDEAAIRAEMSDLASRRNSKQPVQYPSAGSFFKRPEGYFAGKLIQDAGCKGLSVGGAEVSTLHSGFIINKGGATASDIIKLMKIVQERVYDKFQVMLEPEVRII